MPFARAKVASPIFCSMDRLSRATFDEKQQCARFGEEVATEAEGRAALDAGIRQMPFKQIENIVGLAKDASLLYKQANLERKRELLRILLSDLTASGENISAKLTIPFTLIAETGEIFLWCTISGDLSNFG